RIMFSVFILSNVLYANNINFKAKELEIGDFIVMVSNITNTNIIIVDKPQYKIKFSFNDNITKEELFEILKISLESKGFGFYQNGNFYKIIDKSNDKFKIRKTINLQNIESKDISEFLVNSYDKNLVTLDINKNTNSVVLYGLEHEVNEIEEFIKSIDINKEQVYVEAKIVEISQAEIKNIGMKYGLNSALLSGNALYTLSSELGIKGGSVTIPSGFDLDYPSHLVKSSLNLWATLSLLEKNGALEIISEPSILALNNQESSIYVGKRQSVQTSTTLDKNGNPIPHIERTDIGLKLKVKPRVTNDLKVMLDIIVEQEETNSNENSLAPISDKKEIRTSAIVESGENVILGGYIQNKTYKVEDKIPFWGDIPAIGELFKHSSDNIDKKTLVVILTPYIVPKDKNLTILQDNLSKLKLLEKSYSTTLISKLEDNSEQMGIMDK
ncbi:MAG: secretin N-terminal domain-containing protein, partial [Arcobacteraceae bacterium]